MDTERRGSTGVLRETSLFFPHRGGCTEETHNQRMNTAGAALKLAQHRECVAKSQPPGTPSHSAKQRVARQNFFGVAGSAVLAQSRALLGGAPGVYFLSLDCCISNLAPGPAQYSLLACACPGCRSVFVCVSQQAIDQKIRSLSTVRRNLSSEGPFPEGSSVQRGGHAAGSAWVSKQSQRPPAALK